MTRHDADGIGGRRTFSNTHPADDFRFKLHVTWLEREGWTQELEDRTPSVFHALMTCKDLDVNIGTFKISTPVPLPPEEVALRTDFYDWMLKTFWSFIPLMEEHVAKTLNTEPRPIDDFREHDSAVSNLLAHGVVPSTIFCEDGRRSYPTPPTILNSGFFFFLTKMDALLDRVKSTDTCVEKRLKYEARLNEWLSKAIEDWHILAKT
ncbi:MAG: hypothetical protein ACYTAS_15830 [Planctomycetota bacterium]|jgi:hypothetical protein